MIEGIRFEDIKDKNTQTMERIKNESEIAMKL